MVKQEEQEGQSTLWHRDLPQGHVWGETSGLYPRMVESIRTMGANVFGTPTHGRCPITASAIGKRIEWDPWVRGPGIVIREAIAAAIKIGGQAVASASSSWITYGMRSTCGAQLRVRWERCKCICVKSDGV